MKKEKMLNNKNSDYNTRFDDTYRLYRVQYRYRLSSHYEQKRRETNKKRNSRVIKVVIVILDLMTLTGYIEYNIGIDYHHIRNRGEERHMKKEKVK